MKKRFAIVLVLVMLPLFAFSEHDSVSLTHSIDGDGFTAAVSAMASFLGLDADPAKQTRTVLNEHCYVSILDGIRSVFYDGRIIKASAMVDFSDTEKSVNRLYLIASVFEGRLFEKDTLSADDQHSAFSAASKVVDVATDLFSDNMIRVHQSGQEGFSLLAATGEYVYHWEFLNGSLWLSVRLISMPEGIT